jgi:hypothetical protein
MSLSTISYYLNAKQARFYYVVYNSSVVHVQKFPVALDINKTIAKTKVINW